jgi:hypothetical protein
MPVINGVYLKDFTALPGAVADANIIPIAISGDNIAYRTTVAGIVTDARVTSKLLTGLSITGSAILATDTILQAFGKVQNQLNNRVSSVGLSMPSAFSVASSPITGSGTIAVTGAGLASQYIRGDGQLADFPTGGGGGGSSVSYYLNGSVNQGTFGGNTYYEMNKVPVFGAGTDFSIGADGYIAQFITDANDPNALLIPAGNWNFETYFSASSGGGSPSFYIELYKYNGSTFTLIASSSATPELIAFGTTINPYFSSLAVPETVLAATDRLAIRIYVTNSGRTITLHTENSHLCQVITTFTTGIQALNGLTKQTQYFTVGTSGTDFNISSATDTHTFNLPNADSSTRGVVSTGTQSFAGVKTFLNNIKASDQFYIREQNALNLLANHTQVQANNTYFAFTNGAGTGSATFTYNGSHNYTLPGATGTIALVGGAGVGTVTSVAALTLGTTGTDLSSTVANGTTTPVITLNVPTASATNRGALSSADWSTFNSKQGAITLTTTGTSGAATFISNTLNVPDYGSALSAYLPLTGGTLSTTNTTETLRIVNAGTGYGLFVQSDSYFQGIVTFQSGFKSTTNTFTLPSATGTLALTSDLSAYLPLTGGTLTGGLNGTSYNFTSTGVVQGGLTVGANAYQNYGAIFVGGSTTVGSSQYAIITDASMNGVSNVAFQANCKIRAAATATNGYGLYVQNPELGASATLTNNYAVYIANQTSGGTLNYSIYSAGGLNYFGGATELGAALTGTSATFSGNVTANNGSVFSAVSSLGTVFTVMQSDNTAGYLGTNSNHPLVLRTDSTERMRITSGGEVYIAGTTDQGAYNLQVNGTGVWGAGAYVNGSDLRLKNSITPLNNSLDLINKMKPVTYKFNEDYSKDQSIQTGFIAQDLQELLKDEVYLEGIVKEGGEYLSVAYQSIIPLLVKAVQELSAEIKELKTK